MIYFLITLFKRISVLLSIMVFTLLFSGCSDNTEYQKTDKQNILQESVKENDKLEIKINHPEFDNSKAQPEVDMPEKKGSPLDF